MKENESESDNENENHIELIKEIQDDEIKIDQKEIQLLLLDKKNIFTDKQNEDNY